jgi:hypothetical protein
MKNILILIIAILFCNYSFSQIRVNNTSFSTSPAGFAFIDGANSSTYAGVNFAGKGVLFPKTDLTSITGSNVAPGTNSYDGAVVYNVGTGAIPASAMGSSATDVTPGFYYYSNSAGADVDAGVWTPLGGGSSSAVAIADGVASDSYATINATQEKVVRLTGIMADGTNTTLNLDAALTTAGVTIAKFRKAAIYDTSGDLVMQATGGYTTGTDILVTGNGMMNKLLPVGSYSVEVYFTE